ncbi:MAG: TIGR03013 family PEP-CTERM/XrtA system glycosyltransferase [Deltaproteobacteria bacterium]|nr:TIGR03013 family PEP-CTERM/XrtA system glycosyltransferase [Deltaproteobacteria bacterium]
MLAILRSRRGLLYLIELVLIMGVVLVAALVRLGSGLISYRHLPWKALLVAIVTQFAMYYLGLYDRTLIAARAVVYRRTVLAVALAVATCLGLFWAVPPLEIGRGLFLLTAFSLFILLPIWRVLVDLVITTRQLHRKTLIVGAGDLAVELGRLVMKNRAMGYDLVGFLDQDRARLGVSILNPGIVGSYDDLAMCVRKYEIDNVIVALPDRRGKLPVEQLLDCKMAGKEVVEAVSFYERLTGRIYVRELKPSQLIFSDGFGTTATTKRLKRVIDIVGSVIGLLLALPIIAITAILVRVTSRGPVFYQQERAGEFGRPFTLVKFRSMRIDAEKGGAVWAKENDDRVTLVGRFIRKSRIDEIPQIWNVLKGEMSLVGPRPERPVFIRELEKEIPFYSQRLHVKPGLTGFAQVRYKYGATTEDALQKLQYDLYYIKNLSVILDLQIMLDTIKVVLFRIGSR